MSCVPINATESQYPLIWACKEAGVERFVPSEFGFIYEFEQFLPTDTMHRATARQKAFIRRVIEITGDFSAAERQRLLEIADKCPVHRTLESEILIETTAAG